MLWSLQGQISNHFQSIPFLLAAKMTGDAVLAYHTALQLNGKAYSVHESFYYLTNTFPRPLTFQGYRFRGVRFPKKLATEKRLFGVNAEERSGVSVRVTSWNERWSMFWMPRPGRGVGRDMEVIRER